MAEIFVMSQKLEHVVGGDANKLPRAQFVILHICSVLNIKRFLEISSNSFDLLVHVIPQHRRRIKTAENTKVVCAVCTRTILKIGCINPFL